MFITFFIPIHFKNQTLLYLKRQHFLNAKVNLSLLQNNLCVFMLYTTNFHYWSSNTQLNTPVVQLQNPLLLLPHLFVFIIKFIFISIIIYYFNY